MSVTETSTERQPTTTEAEYESPCGECDENIEVGTPVARMNSRWVHGPCWHKI